MKTIKTILRVFLILVVAVVLFALFFTSQLKKRALPDYEKTEFFSAITDTVTIYRDAYAIPHIMAKNEHDLYFSTGYIMAQERLWQMDLLRRVTQGRLSEIFGADFIDTDLLLRALRFNKKSEEILDVMDNHQKESLQAFSAGVNYFIEANSKKLPFEFKILGYMPENWTPKHSLNLIGYMAWDLKAGWHIPGLMKLQNELDSLHFQELLPNMLYHKTVVFPHVEIEENDAMAHAFNQLGQLGADVFCGSNTWAVAGEKTNTGKPLLANDMHLGFALPGIWFQMHQYVPGKVNVTGLAIPGAPLVVVGHNDSIAWGMTNTYVDNIDMYEEKINPADTSQYKYMGKWRNIQYQQEIIRDKNGIEYKKLLKFTHRGPCVSEFKNITNKFVTMHWVGDEPGNEYSSIYKLNRAQNWNEFNTAMQTFKSISQNISYADVNGNIGLYACAGVPIRNRDITIGILPGWTDKYDWQGMVPYTELPHTYNPVSGMVSAANNRTTDSTYRHFIGSWYSYPARIDRIREMLESEKQHTVQTFMQMQNDDVSKLAEVFMKNTFHFINAGKLTGVEKQAYEILLSWDFDMDKNKTAPLIFDRWMYQFIDDCISDELSEEVRLQSLQNSKIFYTLLYNILHHQNSVWIDNINTDMVEDFAYISEKSFKNTIEWINENMGTDTTQWQWGRHHQISLQHPIGKVEAMNKAFQLSIGPFAADGSSHTVAPFAYPYLEYGNVVHGASHRNIYNTANWDSSYTVLPAGNSGQPKSRHFNDQAELFFAEGYHNDWFSMQAVKSNAHWVQQYLPE